MLGPAAGLRPESLTTQKKIDFNLYNKEFFKENIFQVIFEWVFF